MATGCLVPHSQRLPSARLGRAAPVSLLCGSRTEVSRSWERCVGSAALGCRGHFCPPVWWLPTPLAHRTVGGWYYVPFAAELRWGYPGLLHGPLGVQCLLGARQGKARGGMAQAGMHTTAIPVGGEMLRLEPGGVSVGRSAPRVNVLKGPGDAWQGGGFIYWREESRQRAWGCWGCVVPGTHGDQ